MEGPAVSRRFVFRALHQAWQAKVKKIEAVQRSENRKGLDNPPPDDKVNSADKLYLVVRA
jgi:hypothetical protein